MAALRNRPSGPSLWMMWRIAGFFQGPLRTARSRPRAPRYALVQRGGLQKARGGRARSFMPASPTAIPPRATAKYQALYNGWREAYDMRAACDQHNPQGGDDGSAGARSKGSSRPRRPPANILVTATMDEAPLPI